MKLPTKLKLALEFLSGYSLDDVKVHYNSNKPKQINAKAYAQGTNIYLAPGEEELLPHEAWHIVQQKQGRVIANTSRKGVSVNDDLLLEQEATLMGEKAKELITKGFDKCKDLLTVKSNMTSVAQLTYDENSEVPSDISLIKIVRRTLKENDPQRDGKYKSIPKEELADLDALNTWLDTKKKTLDISNPLIKDFIDGIISAKIPLAYSGYRKNEKAKFLANLKTLHNAEYRKINTNLKKSETESYLPPKALGLNIQVEQDAKSTYKNAFTISRPVTELFYTPYTAMTPFANEFNFYSPISLATPIRAISVNPKTKQVICAVSAMATLLGYIPPTVSTVNPTKAGQADTEAHAAVLRFIQEIHPQGKQLNLASFNSVRGFNIGLATQRGLQVSPQFRPIKGADRDESGRNQDILNETFWTTIFPKLKVGAGVYHKKTSTHVAAFVKQSDSSILYVESNNESRIKGYRGVLVRSQNIKQKPLQIGRGFMIAQRAK